MWFDLSPRMWFDLSHRRVLEAVREAREPGSKLCVLEAVRERSMDALSHA